MDVFTTLFISTYICISMYYMHGEDVMATLTSEAAAPLDVVCRQDSSIEKLVGWLDRHLAIYTAALM